MKEWSDYFVAMLGASAALTGLIFVGISINLTKILSIPKLPNRGLESLILLVNILVVSSLCLVPGQPVKYLGAEILGLGILVWLACVMLDAGMLRSASPDYKKRFMLNILMSQLAVLPYLASGIVILCCGENGVYLLIPAFIFSVLKSLLDAWVLLIEINR